MLDEHNTRSNPTSELVMVNPIYGSEDDDWLREYEEAGEDVDEDRLAGTYYQDDGKVPVEQNWSGVRYGNSRGGLQLAR